jgi:3',5'-cyclic AMP phosphodiesterase CpdA
MIIQIVFFLLLICFTTNIYSICQCDDNSSKSRRLNNRYDRIVEFEEAVAKGEDYIRPYGASQLHDPSSIKDTSYDYSTSDDGCYSEQIHVTLGSASTASVIISYTNKNITTASNVEYSTNKNDLIDGTNVEVATGTSSSYSEIIYVSKRFYSPSMGSPLGTKDEVIKMENTSVWAKDPKTGEHWANYNLVTSVETGLQYDANPYAIYDSPMIFQVSLNGLTPGNTYYYRVSGSCKVYYFTYPKTAASEKDKSIYPFTLGLTADVGQTNVSAATFEALKALNADVVLLAGDLSYADGWIALWDSFGNLIQSLAAYVPLLTTGGNHELSSAEAWLSYMQRYPTPHESSGSPHICYWGREVGPVHIIALCSYAGFTSSSLQYSWLSNYLATKINRKATPWIVMMMHAPWYNSNNGHWKEGELMRQSMEPLLYKYGVDFVLSGHVHSYERSTAVYDNEANQCGTTYLNLGDGGNYENSYTSWRFPADSWSLFREASFGVGEMVIHNSTHAYYAWHRHACGSNDAQAYYMNFSDSCVTPNDKSNQRMLTSDTVWFTRPSNSECTNRWKSTSDSYVGSSSSDSSDNNTLSKTTIALIILTAVFGAMNIIHIGVIVKLLYAPKGNRDTSMTHLSPSSSLTPSDQLERGSSNPLFNPVQAQDAKK